MGPQRRQVCTLASLTNITQASQQFDKISQHYKFSAEANRR